MQFLRIAMQPDPNASVRQSDSLDPARANAFLATLGRSERLDQSDPLPPFFHQLYFWEARPPAQLGRDGHPRTGLGLIPDLGLPRRMWAGGRLTFHRDLCAGDAAEKTSVVAQTTRKDGRSGPLAFVTLRHAISQNDTVCVVEEQDLVYRNDPDPSAPKPIPPAAPQDEAVCVTEHFDSTLLFRYSALTFNGHRIHYDLDYARDVEGYGGLVVHGPLLAQHLMLLATREMGRLATFSFRATSALMHTERAEICWKGREGWVRAPDGRQCMQAEATPRPL